MDLTDLWQLDGTAQAELVRAATSARRNSSTPPSHASSAQPGDQRRHHAAVRPRTRTAADVHRDAPFAGVPLLLKDATSKSKARRTTSARASSATSATVRCARRSWRGASAAGFIFIGKTNCPELSAGITTEPSRSAHAQSLGPQRSAGGSSGGSAAAVARGPRRSPRRPTRRDRCATPRALRRRHAQTVTRPSRPKRPAASPTSRRLGGVRARPLRPRPGARARVGRRRSRSMISPAAAPRCASAC